MPANYGLSEEEAVEIAGKDGCAAPPRAARAAGRFPGRCRPRPRPLPLSWLLSTPGVRAGVFSRYDTNDNGVLEASELRQLCVQLGKDLTDEELSVSMAAAHTSATTCIWGGGSGWAGWEADSQRIAT